jgi:HEPN domain-containing protein
MAPSPAEISKAELANLARARLADASVLLKGKRFDGSFYLCGYAVELAVKARICRTLRRTGLPQSGDRTKSLRTHDLDALLLFSGVETKIRTTYAAEWGVVLDWNSEKRYDPIGKVTAPQAANMIAAAKRLLKYLLS